MKAIITFLLIFCVIVVFHEFGHALHGFFASQQYASISGTQTPRDFVEMPSQFNESFASIPEVFNHYSQAIHRLAIDKVSQLGFLFSGIGSFVFFKQ